MIFDGIDLNTATMEEIQEMELGHFATQLIALGMSKRLCSLEGKEIIAEYGYNGDFNAVVSVMNTYYEVLETIKMAEYVREDIIIRKELLIKHREEADSDVKAEAEKLAIIMEAVNTRDPEYIMATTIRENAKPEQANIKLRQDALHNANLCTCYTNWGSFLY